MATMERWVVKIRGDATSGRSIRTIVEAESRIAATMLSAIMFPGTTLVEPPRPEAASARTDDAMGRTGS